MKRASVLAIVTALFAVGCGSSSDSTTAPTTPANPNITFTATLLPSNEVPAIPNPAEGTSSGTATIVFVPTKDAAGNITSAVGTASVAMQGFPAGSTITLAHIHTGAAGVGGGVFIGFIPAANIPVVNGAASFSQTNNATGDQLTTLMNNPAGFYFNVHTQQNPAGVMRGQLVRTQ
jgi:hypothetical protein